MAVFSTYSFDGLTSSTGPLAGMVDDQGHVWKQHPQAAKSHIENSANHVASVSTTNMLCLDYVDAVSSSADQSTTATLVRKTERAATGNIFGVVARLDPTAHTCYRFLFNDNTADEFRLEKVVADSVTRLDTKPASSIGVDTNVGGAPFTVTIKCVGTTISGLVNGVEVTTPVTDSSITSAGFAGIVSLNNQDGVGSSHTVYDDFSASTIVTPVSATKIAITTQPSAAVDVGDTVTIVAAAQDASGNTQTDFIASSAWNVRARTAPAGWDLTTVLETDTAVNGVIAASFTVPMAGTWSFGVDDDSNALTDSPDTTEVLATFATFGAPTTIQLQSVVTMDILKGGSAVRRRLPYRATAADGTAVSDLTGKPNISINGATPATTAAAANSVYVGNGWWYVELADASLALGDLVMVTDHGSAIIATPTARVVAVDVGTAPQVISVDGSNQVIVGGLSSTALDAMSADILGTAQAELATVPNVDGATIAEQIAFLYHDRRNKAIATDTAETVYKADGTTPLATRDITDDTTTTTRSAAA